MKKQLFFENYKSTEKTKRCCFFKYILITNIYIYILQTNKSDAQLKKILPYFNIRNESGYIFSSGPLSVIYFIRIKTTFFKK